MEARRAREPVLLSLSAGRNLVGWGGADGEPFAEVAARFGDALVEAERWDAEAGRYDRYRPGADDAANTLRELGTGDALWVELAADARWWQSGLWGTEFEYLGELGEEERLSLRGELAAVVTFFAERYGIEPPRFTVEYDPNLDIFAGALPGRIFLSREVMDYALRDVTLAHEYFHILQGHYAKGRRSPAWMTEGTATYAGGLYRIASRGITAEQLRHARWRHTGDVTDVLGDLELIRLFYPGEAPVYSLAAMAVEWLEGRVALDGDGEDFAPEEVGWPDSFTAGAAYIEYYRLLAGAEEWEEAFQEAYGIAAGDFYDVFGRIGARSTPRPPRPFRDRPLLTSGSARPREAHPERSVQPVVTGGRRGIPADDPEASRSGSGAAASARARRPTGPAPHSG